MSKMQELLKKANIFKIFKSSSREVKNGDQLPEVRVIQNLDTDEYDIGIKDLKEKAKREEKEKKRKEKEVKRAERAHTKAVRKAAKEELKKDKEELYQMRKNTFFRVIRVLFWMILLIILIRGIVVTFRPDPTVEINKTIEEFKNELSLHKEQNNEVLAFAENFVYHYLTYDVDGEKEYAEKIMKFTNENVLNSNINFDNSSRVIYVKAYKKENYTENQVDVYVFADIEYIKKVANKDKTNILEERTTNTVKLKVPIAMDNGFYIVENTPLFINDNIKINDYENINYEGVEIAGSEDGNKIDEALSNFFVAYYEGKQSVIDYFLAPEVDKSDFVALDGRVKFVEINSSHYYTFFNNNSKDILGIIVITVKDINEVEMVQKLNIVVTYKDERFYVKSMNTRTTNLNLNEEETKNE